MEVSRPVLQLVKHGAVLHCLRISFVPDSQCFLVAWCSGASAFLMPPTTISYEIYSRTGKLMASFCDTLPYWRVAMALVPVNKVAIADVACFKVWDLTSGLLLAVAGPETSASSQVETAGQIAVNPYGNMLALIPAAADGNQVAMYIYAVTNLELLVCYPPKHTMYEQTCSSLGSALVWGLQGCMLAFGQAHYLDPSPRHPAWGLLQRIAIQADGMLTGEPALPYCEPCSTPALNPCGSFVLLFQPQGPRLHIREVVSGRIVLSQAVRLPDAPPRADVRYDFALHWSSCGRILLARVRVMATGHMIDPWASERLLVVQLLCNYCDAAI